MSAPKIVSAAQHAMFKRAADDADYAAERGITQDMAREAVKAHEDAGAPDLPERAMRRAVAPRAKSKIRDDRPMFLTSHRG